VPRFAEWLKKERAAEQPMISEEDRATLAAIDTPGWWREDANVAKLREPILRAAANYFLHARGRARLPYDPVARFHLGNGASLDRLNWPGDLSDRGIRQAEGLMVNYRYNLGEIEQNHEAYAEHRTIVTSNAVKRLARPAMELVATAG
jgi:malonyl-CoA decarboxylase